MNKPIQAKERLIEAFNACGIEFKETAMSKIVRPGVAYDWITVSSGDCEANFEFNEDGSFSSLNIYVPE